jgi:thiamine monophosphate kinase
LPAAKFSALRAAGEKSGVGVTKVGQVVSGQGTRFLRDGKILSFAHASYSHF